ncbi:MAG: hypothetical protein GY884_07640 [Proteobacteria bacterium]|nr:hypothetical protein [Pseudomonadota bacterium]
MLAKPLLALMLVPLLGGCRGDVEPPTTSEDSDSEEVLETGDGGETGETGDSAEDTGEVVVEDQVVTYPAPDGVTVGNHYAVTLEQGGAEHSSFVYEVNRQQSSNQSLTTSWTTFSFQGDVTVSVTRRTGDIGTCVVLPSSAAIETTVSGDTCTFELDRPRQLSVELDGDITHPMLVFANALETDVPDPDDPEVLYFAPGLHDIGDTTLSSGQQVYVEGGAVVYGRFLVGAPDALAEDVQDITIRGRGILSGEGYPQGSTDNDHLINFWGVDESLIEGVTLIQSPLYNILMYGSNNVVRNVKMISWWYSTDGVYVGGGGLVEDCFVKVNDDAFKLYESNTTVRDTVIWQLENGSPFQISWNMPTDNSGFVVQNIDIIRMEHRSEQINLSAVNSVHGGSGHMSGYLFEDIRIENADWRLFYLSLQRTEFSPPDNELGQISDVTFRNISATGSLPQPSAIFGWDAEHGVSDVTFQNLRINGELIETAAEGNFQIDAATTDNISFQVGTFITDTFTSDAFLQGEDCEAQLSAGWGGADSVEVRDDQLHLLNTLADPESECFTTAGWQTAEPVTPPFTVEYTVDVADSEFGLGGYALASLIWDEANHYGLSTDVSLVKETLAWHGQQDGYEDVITEDQYTLVAQGLGERVASLPTDGVETITIRQVVTESDQTTYWAADDGELELVHTYANVIGPDIEITPMLRASDCNVWSHDDFDLAVDSVAVFSEDAPICE